MLAPISWLKEYVDFEVSIEKLADDLLFSGTKVEKVLTKEGEKIFDLEITPNRADCLGLIGIAREIAVLYNLELNIPKHFGETRVERRNKSINFQIKDKSLCPYYTIGVIDNLRVGDSPEWLKKRLSQVSIRSLNNIVDITNYVMIETGQPMHAFDYHKIKGGMILRGAKNEEKVKTLDGVERRLNKGAIIIEDSEKLIDLAGLLGGKDSEVDKNTETILLHVPLYNRTAIRKTSNFVNLRSEASNRFEKELDPNAHRYAFERALHLLKIEASGIMASEIKSVNYPVKNDTFEIRPSKINAILGIWLKDEEMMNILVKLGFEVYPSPSLDDKKFEIRSPTWRPDVKIEEDIAEEIGRIYGYNNLPKTLPTGVYPTHEDSFKKDWRVTIRENLRAQNFNETYYYSLISLDLLKKAYLNPKNTLKVSNPMTVDHEYLRPTLLVGLLESIEININNYKKISLFENGRIFSKEIEGKTKLPQQPHHIGAVSTQLDFYGIKSVVMNVIAKLNIDDFEFIKSESANIWSENSAKLIVKGDEVGIIGELNANVLNNFSISNLTSGFELNLEKLISHASEKILYKPLPKYPSIKEDLSIIVDDDISAQSILESIKSLKDVSVNKAEISEVIPWHGRKSVLINLEYYNSKKTLTDKDAGVFRSKIVRELKKRFKAEIR